MPTLPWVRFTSVVIFLVALDSLICVVLWLAGGSSGYLEHSVKEFSFTHSTFDLAVIAVARGIVLVPCLYYLERYSLLTVSARGRRRNSALKFARICRTGVFVAAAVSIAYMVVKGSFMLHQITSGHWEPIRMHISYRILCTVALVFPLLEVAVGVASWYFLGRLVHVHQLRLLINAEEGEEEEEEEGRKKKKVDLKRLFLLAKPVSKLSATDNFSGLSIRLLSSLLDHRYNTSTRASIVAVHQCKG